MKRAAESAVALPPPDERARFLASVQRGIEDVEAGRVISDEELDRRLEAWFGPLPKGR